MNPVLQGNDIIELLRREHGRGAARANLLASAAHAIRASGEPYTGVYLYMVTGDQLVLEASSGAPTEHTTIPVGSGLCGRAVAEGRDLNVADVGADPDYIACSVTTRSELICLIHQGDTIIGQIDVDSDTEDSFPPEEEAEVRKVADLLGELL